MANLRVLIVDDEADSARELEARLVGLGYDVAAIAGSGGEAVSIAAATAPDLVLIDMDLRGDLDSLRTAGSIRRDRSVPIVFMGTQAAEARLRRTGSAEATGYLVQPFGDRELYLSIELVVCKQRSAKTAHELQGFFDVSIDMFCFLDFSGHFKRLNPAWERTLGFTREELMSRPFIEFVHPDDRERTLKQNAQVRAGDRALGFENRYLCKDGSHRWFLWNAAPVTALGIIYSVARDITVRKEVEMERMELVRTLEAALAEVGTLQDILPICMYCRKIRDDADYWHTVEGYISEHTTTRFSHGICPSCMETRVDLMPTPDDAPPSGQ
jgi:PAS domain S-box-containing protein